MLVDEVEAQKSQTVARFRDVPLSAAQQQDFFNRLPWRRTMVGWKSGGIGLITDRAYIAYLNPQGAWTGLQSIGKVKTERQLGETVSRETRSYITTLTRIAECSQAVRTHWGSKIVCIGC